MSKTQCTAKCGCTNTHKGWPSCSVGEFLDHNPGWMWFIDNASEAHTLCPDCAIQVIQLTENLEKYLGEYGVNPMIRKMGQEWREKGRWWNE